MSILIIKEMKIENFKGIGSLSINFSDAETRISGANETCKTSIYDAFCYCLTGKNSKGETTFGIKPNFSSEMVSPTVEIECELDGKPVNFKKVMQAKFAKDKTFKKYQTECFINGLPKGVQEFEEYINANIATTELFKLATNPKYFTEQLSVKKGETVLQRQRNMLYKMAELADDTVIIENNVQFVELLPELDRYADVSEYKKYLKTTIANVKAELNDIPTKIQQQSLNFVECNFTETAIQKAIEIANSKNQSINQKLSSINSGEESKSFEKVVDEVEEKILQLNLKNNAFREELKSQNAIIKEKAMSEKMEKSNKFWEECRNNDNDIHDVEFKIESVNHEISRYKSNVEEKREEYSVAAKKKLSIGEKCNLCHREFSEKDVEAFEAQKKSQLESIVEFANREKKKISALKETLDKLSQEKERLEKVKESLFKSNSEDEEIKLIDIHNVENFIDEMDCLQNNLQVAKQNQREFLSGIEVKRKEILLSLDEVESEMKQLREKQYILSANAMCQSKIDDLNDEKLHVTERLDDLQRLYDMTNDFINLKCETATEKINGLFSKVKWKLFDFTQDEKIIETCIPMLNGVEYKDLSASTKYMCGLDIIDGFQKYYNVCLPVFIDEKECITESIGIKTQHVTLVAVEENCPLCGGEAGRKQRDGMWQCKSCGNKFKKKLNIDRKGTE